MDLAASRGQADLSVLANHLEVYPTRATDDQDVRRVDFIHRKAATREQVLREWSPVRGGECSQEVKRRSADGPVSVGGLYELGIAERELDGRMRAKICRLVDLLIQPVKARRTKHEHGEVQVAVRPTYRRSAAAASGNGAASASDERARGTPPRATGRRLRSRRGAAVCLQRLVGRRARHHLTPSGKRDMATAQASQLVHHRYDCGIVHPVASGYAHGVVVNAPW
ncbi:MAG: hypothetical protein K0R38_948 [Polyangiaceae bacterium]|nr:hypothetical protein [Polyangiaceae bacterium]